MDSENQWQLEGFMYEEWDWEVAFVALKPQCLE